MKSPPADSGNARVAGVERDYSMAEMRWRDPRQSNPAVVADMATMYNRGCSGS